VDGESLPNLAKPPDMTAIALTPPRRTPWHVGAGNDVTWKTADSHRWPGHHMG
jgi:hypothetical protein